LPPARRVRNGPTAALVLRKCGWNVPPDPVRRSLVGATIDAASPPSHHLWGHVLAAAVDRTQRRRAQDVWVGVGELEGSGRAGWVVEGFSDRAGGPAMATAAIFGLLANSSLVVGVLLGLATKPPAAAAGGSHRLRRRGAGLGPDLRPWARPSSARPGLMPLPVSLSAPLSTCSLSPGWSAWPPAPQTHRPRPPGRGAGAAAKPETTEVAATTGLALLVGALIDGIPESAAIGLSLHAEGRSLGISSCSRRCSWPMSPRAWAARGDAGGGSLPRLHHRRLDRGRGRVRACHHCRLPKLADHPAIT
jgi:hypothetical protein